MIDTENATDYIAPLVKELTGLDLIGDRTREFSALVPLVEECVKAGVSVLIVDSVTHFWRNLMESYLAGVNEMRARKGQQPRARLEFQDYAQIKQQWAKWADAYLNAPMSIIIAGRAGYEYDMSVNEETGRKELEKTGIKLKAEGEFGFEPSCLAQCELDQEPTGDGKFKQVRTMTILKDRFGVIDGSVFTFSKGKTHTDEMQAVWNAFKPHLDLLKAGQHSTVTTKVTAMPVSEEGDVDWARERKARTILTEEIQGAIVSVIPGLSADEKKRKADILQRVFGTRSWTAIENMQSAALREAVPRLKRELGIEVAPEPPDASGVNPDDQIPGAEVAPKPDICTEIRQLLHRDGIRESVLLGYLAEIGTLERGAESLEDANHRQPALLGMVIAMWKDISERILEALGKAKA